MNINVIINVGEKSSNNIPKDVSNELSLIIAVRNPSTITGIGIIDPKKNCPDR